jgi:hypothetical protein
MASALRHGASHDRSAVAIDDWADAIRPYEIGRLFVRNNLRRSVECDEVYAIAAHQGRQMAMVWAVHTHVS